MAIVFGVVLIVLRKKSKRKSKLAISAEENPSQYVRAYGTKDDTQAVICAFNDEYNKSGLRQEVNPNFYLSENYLLVVGNVVEIAKLSSIIWVYYEKIVTAFKNQRYTIHQFTFFFKDDNKKMVFGGTRTENDRDNIMQALKNSSLLVESDKALLKLAGKNYAEFERECIKRASSAN